MKNKIFSLMVVFLLLVSMPIEAFALEVGDEVEYIEGCKLEVQNSEEYKVNVNYCYSTDFGTLSYVKENCDANSKPYYAKDASNSDIDTYIKKTDCDNYTYTTKLKETEVGVIKRYTVLGVQPLPVEDIQYESDTILVAPTSYYDYTGIEMCKYIKEIGISRNKSAQENLDIILDSVVHDLVYDLSEKGLSNAEKVVQDKKGVCSDYTTLTVALLRSVGIPARGVSGVMTCLSNVNDVVSLGSECSHMWTEIKINDIWYILDTTVQIKNHESENGCKCAGLDTDMLQCLESARVYLPLSIVDSLNVGNSLLKTRVLSLSGSGEDDVAVSLYKNPSRIRLVTGEPEESDEYQVTKDLNELFMLGIEDTQNKVSNGENKGKDNFDESNWSYADANNINKLANLDNILIDEDLNRELTRLEVVELLDDTLNLEETLGVVEDAGFSDISNMSANRLKVMGFISGLPDGSFQGDKTITRGELFTILGNVVKMVDEEHMGKDYKCNVYSDIDNTWAKGNIEYLSQYMDIKGFPDGTIRAGAKITTGEVVTLIMSLLRSATYN